MIIYSDNPFNKPMCKFQPLDEVALDNHEQVYSVISYIESNNTYTLLDSYGTLLTGIEEKDITFIRSKRPSIKYDFLAMYVIVKDTAPIGLGINACTHAGFIAGRTFSGEVFDDWLKFSFRKRTCLVSPEEFDKCIEEIEKVSGDYVVFRENDWENQELSAAFSPRYSFPPIFKTLKLHPGFVEERGK